jgi:hypothetical protein
MERVEKTRGSGESHPCSIRARGPILWQLGRVQRDHVGSAPLRSRPPVCLRLDDGISTRCQGRCEAGGWLLTGVSTTRHLPVPVIVFFFELVILLFQLTLFFLFFQLTLFFLLKLVIVFVVVRLILFQLVIVFVVVRLILFQLVIVFVVVRLILFQLVFVIVMFIVFLIFFILFILVDRIRVSQSARSVVSSEIDCNRQRPHLRTAGEWRSRLLGPK